MIPIFNTGGEMDFAGEVLRRIEELGLNVNQAEARAGLPQGYIRGVVRDDDKRAIPNINKAETIAKALGLELYFGPPRTPESEPPTLELDGDEFAAVPRVAVEASAGAGAFNDEPEVVGKLAFRQDWLRKIGVKPEKSMLITVTGESMMPDLEPGDLALIDQDKAEWEHNRVFALVDLDGAVRIKRILLDGKKGLVLVSDNAAENPPELRLKGDANRVRPLGRVVWSGHKWE